MPLQREALIRPAAAAAASLACVVLVTLGACGGEAEQEQPPPTGVGPPASPSAAPAPSVDPATAVAAAAAAPSGAAATSAGLLRRLADALDAGDAEAIVAMYLPAHRELASRRPEHRHLLGSAEVSQHLRDRAADGQRDSMPAQALAGIAGQFSAEQAEVLSVPTRRSRPARVLLLRVDGEWFVGDVD